METLSRRLAKAFYYRFCGIFVKLIRNRGKLCRRLSSWSRICRGELYLISSVQLILFTFLVISITNLPCSLEQTVKYLKLTDGEQARNFDASNSIRLPADEQSTPNSGFVLQQRRLTKHQDSARNCSVLDFAFHVWRAKHYVEVALYTDNGEKTKSTFTEQRFKISHKWDNSSDVDSNDEPAYTLQRAAARLCTFSKRSAETLFLSNLDRFWMPKTAERGTPTLREAISGAVHRDRRRQATSISNLVYSLLESFSQSTATARFASASTASKQQRAAQSLFSPPVDLRKVHTFSFVLSKRQQVKHGSDRASGAVSIALAPIRSFGSEATSSSMRRSPGQKANVESISLSLQQVESGVGSMKKNSNSNMLKAQHKQVTDSNSPSERQQSKNPLAAEDDLQQKNESVQQTDMNVYTAGTATPLVAISNTFSPVPTPTTVLDALREYIISLIGYVAPLAVGLILLLFVMPLLLLLLFVPVEKWCSCGNFIKWCCLTRSFKRIEQYIAGASSAIFEVDSGTNQEQQYVNPIAKSDQIFNIGTSLVEPSFSPSSACFSNSASRSSAAPDIIQELLQCAEPNNASISTATQQLPATGSQIDATKAGNVEDIIDSSVLECSDSATEHQKPLQQQRVATDMVLRVCLDRGARMFGRSLHLPLTGSSCGFFWLLLFLIVVLCTVTLSFLYSTQVDQALHAAHCAVAAALAQLSNGSENSNLTRFTSRRDAVKTVSLDNIVQSQKRNGNVAVTPSSDLFEQIETLLKKNKVSQTQIQHALEVLQSGERGEQAAAYLQRIPRLGEQGGAGTAARKLLALDAGKSQLNEGEDTKKRSELGRAKELWAAATQSHVLSALKRVGEYLANLFRSSSGTLKGHLQQQQRQLIQRRIDKPQTTTGETGSSGKQGENHIDTNLERGIISEELSKPAGSLASADVGVLDQEREKIKKAVKRHSIESHISEATLQRVLRKKKSYYQGDLFTQNRINLEALRIAASEDHRFLGIRPFLTLLKQICRTINPTSPESMSSTTSKVLAKGLAVQNVLLFLNELLSTVELMLQKPVSKHRNIAQVSVLPLLHWFRAKVLPLMMQNASEMQHKAREIVQRVQEIEEHFTEQLSRFDVEKTNAAADHLTGQATVFLESLFVYRKVFVPAVLYIISAFLASLVVGGTLYLMFLNRRGEKLRQSRQFTGTSVAACWWLLFIFGSIGLIAGALGLLLSVFLVDICIFASSDLQEPHSLHTLFQQKFHQGPTAAQLEHAIVACFARSHERNLADRWNFSAAYSALQKHVHGCKSELKLPQVHLFERIANMTIFLLVLIKEQAGLYIPDRTQASTTIHTGPEPQFFGLQENTVEFNSIFNVEEAELIGPPGVDRGELLPFPPFFNTEEALLQYFSSLSEYPLAKGILQVIGEEDLPTIEQLRQAQELVDGRARSGRYRLYGLRDLETKIAPFFFEFLHSKDSADDMQRDPLDAVEADSTEARRKANDFIIQLPTEQCQAFGSALEYARRKALFLQTDAFACINDPFVGRLLEALQEAQATDQERLEAFFRQKHISNPNEPYSIKQWEKDVASFFRRIHIFENNTTENASQSLAQMRQNLLVPCTYKTRKQVIQDIVDIALSEVIEARRLLQEMKHAYEEQVVGRGQQLAQDAYALFRSLDCTPVYRSVVTLQKLLCREIADRGMLLSVTWMFLAFLALLLFILFFVMSLWLRNNSSERHEQERQKILVLQTEQQRIHAYSEKERKQRLFEEGARASAQTAAARARARENQISAAARNRQRKCPETCIAYTPLHFLPPRTAELQEKLSVDDQEGDIEESMWASSPG